MKRPIKVLSRIAIGVDAARSTGVGLWTPQGYGGGFHCNIESRRWSEAQSVDAVMDLLGPVGGVVWCGAVERPFNPRGGRGRGQAPMHAFKYWQGVLAQVARRRHKELGQGRYRKPTIVTPKASEWRAPLGIRTRRMFEGDDVKAAVRSWLKTVHGLDIEQTDEMEGAAIAAWLHGAATSIGSIRVGRKTDRVTWVP